MWRRAAALPRLAAASGRRRGSARSFGDRELFRAHVPGRRRRISRAGRGPLVGFKRSGETLVVAGSTSSPVAPSTTTSGTALTLVATTGRPASIASSRTIRSPPTVTCGRIHPPARASHGFRFDPGAYGGAQLQLVDECRVSASSGPPPRMARCASGTVDADAREPAEQRRVVLLRDQPADSERKRRLRRDPRRGRRRLEGAAGSSSRP